MVHRIRVLRAVLYFAGCLGAAASALAADPPMHNGAGASDAAGRGRADRNSSTADRCPATSSRSKFNAPPGAAISLAVNDQFTEPMPAPVKAGMLIGAVYRLRVIRIPQHEGLEVFPTIEVIDRLYPPRGQELRFPVPVELTQEDLELASHGSFVTRVIYLENPHEAIPGQSDPVHQNWFDAPPQDDPLSVASGMGRPMVILRIGSRTPDDSQQPDSQFLYHSPPLLLLAASPHPPAVRPAEPVPAPNLPKSQPKASPNPPANPVEPAAPLPLPRCRINRQSNRRRADLA